MHLQNEALKVAREEAQAKQISDAVHQLIVDVLKQILLVRGYSLGHISKTEAACRACFRNQYEVLDRLELLLPDQKSRAVIAGCRKGTRDAENTLNQVREAARAGNSDLATLFRDARRKLDEAASEMFSPELLQLAADSDKNCRLYEKTDAQEAIRVLILCLLVVSVLLSLGTAIYFSKEIAGRINEVSANAARFSMAKPLGEPIAGTDEIADLDKVFRTMAELLEATVLKQKAVFNNARDMICTLDRGLVVTSVNPACINLLGKGDDALLGTRIVSLVVEEERLAFAEALASLTTGREPESLTVQMLGRENLPIDVICSAHWSLAEQSFFCVFHDISALKTAERLRQDVVNMVTHDIRSPLHAIINFEEMLGTGALGALSEKGERLLTMSKRSSRAINLLVNDLLDSEKLRAGQLTLEKSSFAISDCIDEAISSLALLAEQQKIELVVTSCDARLVADQHRICQVVTNLVANAIKFSESGDKVLIKSRAGGGWLTVVVEDSGSGIAPEELGLVFESFRQGTSKKAYLGTGLGLSICKALIELHGGTISAESVFGKGSTFSFKVPLGS